NNGHKQYGFVSTFLYNKHMNKFIFELRGQGNSQYKSKLSSIGGKRKM
ncbi:3629_t:CDS:1, partial [Racocetra persica]